MLRKSLLIHSLLLFCSCARSQPVTDPPEAVSTAQGKKNAREIIETYLDPLIADGFSFPFGDGEGGGSYKSKNGKEYSGWYIATHTAEEYSLGIHTGEDWNGVGGGNTDEGQPVYATAKGIVLSAKDEGSPWGNVVLAEHRYIENGAIKKVYSLYAHLEKITINEGDTISKRQQIGTIGTGNGAYPAHLHFEMRMESMTGFDATYWPSSNNKTVKWVKENYYSPSEFIKKNRSCIVPSSAAKVIIAIKHEYKIFILNNGTIAHEYAIALSQDPEGHKQQQGDNRMPEGAYRIIQKSKGPFSGDYSAYFGPRWIRINYPNNYDAYAGLQKKLITKQQCEKIVNANNAGSEPDKNTKLGGGIGIHGWAGDWPESLRHLTWGCISIANADLPKFYDQIENGTDIFILP